MYLFLGNCFGSFTPNGGIFIGDGWGVFDFLLTVADVSGDGCPDMYARQRSDGSLYLFHGNCFGSFTPNGGIFIGAGWGAFDFLVAPGDVSGDGCPDMYARQRSDGSLYLFHGNCFGSFTPNGGIFIGTGWGAFDFLVSPGDVSNDGCPDMYARARGDGSLFLFNSNCAGGFTPNGGIFIGTGWGAFDALPGSCEQPSGDAAGSPCSPDDDGDGYTDAQEINTYGTNPASPDTDADGVSDGPLGVAGPPVVAAGPDNCPLVPNPDQLDTNHNGIGDACDAPAPVSVGGIAEQPDVAALPSAASSGRDYTVYILGAAVAILAATGAAGWRRRRMCP